MKNSHKETVSIIGLGVVGLTTAIGFALKGGSYYTGDLYDMFGLQAKNPRFCHKGANLMHGKTA